MDFKRTSIILGPTAVGKTEVSIALAERIGGEIISADAFQVYRGMDVGTAKPTPGQRRRVPHHLIDILDLSERYSVARFRQMALELIPKIKKRGRQPLIVGGAALYIKCLVDGLFNSPPADHAFRSRLRREEEEKGPGYLHGRLAELDPASASRLHKNNLKRIVRALEVLELTGAPISRWQTQWEDSESDEPRMANDETGSENRGIPDPHSPIPNPYLMIGLKREKKDLYGRIDRRVGEMFRNGLVEETKKLLGKGANLNRVAWQALGYKEVEGFLRGEYSLEETRRRLAQQTRRFAKRQLTWWKRDGRIRWVDAFPDDTAGKIAETVIGILKEEEI